MKVLTQGAPHSYTGAGRVEASGSTLAQILDDSDRRYTGIRFRMVDEQQRLPPHLHFFFAGEQLRDLAQPSCADGELTVLQALAGG